MRRCTLSGHYNVYLLGNVYVSLCDLFIYSEAKNYRVCTEDGNAYASRTPIRCADSADMYIRAVLACTACAYVQ
jgi:hypothetical protein